jgi:ABC-2 type transport system permease protein
MIEDNPDMADFFAQLGVASVTDAFLSTAMLIMALFATGFTVSSVLRLRSEEMSGRADPVLAGPVGRRRWAWSHLGVALVGTVVLASVCGVAMGAGAALVLGDAARVGELTAAGLVMVPAMWLLAGATLLVHGLLPRWSLAAWALVAWVFVAAMFGILLDLPQWLLNLSPFQHVPALPASPMSWLPIVVLTALAAALIAGGLAALERRDMART